MSWPGSASDVTPTERWLNVWCIWHTFLETLQECRIHRRIGWITQDFRETCMSHSLTFCLETKMQKCLMKEESCRVYKCDDESFSGSTKRWIFKSMWNIWLVVWHDGQMASWAGLGQWKRTSIPDLQSSVWRSGYASLRHGCHQNFP